MPEHTTQVKLMTKFGSHSQWVFHRSCVYSLHSHNLTSELCSGRFHDKFHSHAQIGNIKQAQSSTPSITQRRKKPEEAKQTNHMKRSRPSSIGGDAGLVTWQRIILWCQRIPRNFPEFSRFFPKWSFPLFQEKFRQNSGWKIRNQGY